ncbi:MAG: hypothetical protein A2X36_03320 [Elusimicrobia bacterium GWA2_69_24]|nr:MAG: hypothetical protein A2X36_03320 [Elusimicrobia bacterium GWA2_69_24]
MSTATKEDLAHLCQLQELDRQADALKRDSDLVPADIAAIRAEVEAEKARFGTIQERAKKLQLQRKEKEAQMAQKEEAIRKHGTELNLVKTNDAFKALLKEIDEKKVAVGQLETDILLLMEEADGVVKEEKALKGELAVFDAERSGRIKVLEARKADLEQRHAECVARRDAVAQSVPAELRSLYEATRVRRAGIGIAAIKGDGCMECNMKITPQSIIDARKGKIAICGNCQRILYIPEASPAAPASAPNA